MMTSEGAAAIEKNEDHRGARQRDQRQSHEVGNQVKINAHGAILAGGWRAAAA